MLPGDGLISAYCEGFGFEACIFRFVSILGERYTYGHAFDFYRQPKQLRVLGNGRQRKSYLYVETLRVSPSIAYSGGDRGWIGDNPFIFLDTTKIRALGWSPKLTIKQGVIKTVEFLKANE
jgi:UDP-glucose 4-epimerase